MTKNVKVDLGDLSYEILIGNDLINEVGNIVYRIKKFTQIIIITDKNVADPYLEKVKASFKEYNTKVNSIVLPNGEKTKSFYFLEFVTNKILSLKIDRNTALIALGGGVIGDLVGLVSSIVLRGLPFIQIPTTLLAQVDSSVGGKTAINSKFGKNLIGSFKQPLIVISSLNTLKTLKIREIYSGYSEIFKYSLIKDKAFFKWLQKNGTKVLDLDPKSLSYAIERSCNIKAQIVSEDEKEKNIRAILNLGHTFGHAIESISNYSSKINHGEAVLVGIFLAIKMSRYLNLCDEKIILDCEKHFKELKLKYKLNQFKLKTSAKELFEIMQYDKKINNGVLNLILLDCIGNAFIYKLTDKSLLLKFLRSQSF